MEVTEKLYTEACDACGGSGIYRGLSQYGSQCFKCKGTGKLTYKQPKDVRMANRVKLAERKERQAAANLSAFEEANPEIAAWWKDSTFDFALSLMAQVRKTGVLSEKQMAAAMRLVEKHKAFVAAREAEAAALIERRKNATELPVEHILVAFENAKRARLRTPKLRLFSDDHSLEFSRAPDYGKNPGAIYVTENGLYLGKIVAKVFEPSRDCTGELESVIQRACSDPEQAAVAYGRKFGVCSCCGRELSNALSIQLGIGPVCRSKFFG